VRTWLARAALRGSALATAWMTPDAAARWGARLGRAWVALRGPRTHVARDQIALAFPDRSPEARDQLLRAHFEHLGRGLFELALLRGRHRATLIARTRVDGIEHLREAEARSDKGGVLCLTAHYGNWELCGVKMASEGVPLSVVHRGFDDEALEAGLTGLRAEGFEAGEMEQLRMGRAAVGVVRALREGRKVVVLLDQNARRSEGVFVPFFGRTACTRDVPARLAMKRHVPVVPVFIRRDPDGLHHRIEFLPSLDLEPGDADDESIVQRNVARMTAAIERAIREEPAQWIWTHRRWRTRPPASAGPTGQGAGR